MLRKFFIVSNRIMSINKYDFTKKVKPILRSPGISSKGSEIEEKISHIEKFKAKFDSPKDKEKRVNLLKQEITSNPEFFNAFPHLKPKIIDEELDVPEHSVNTEINNNYDLSIDRDIRDKKENYFESLLNKHKGYENALKLKEEKEIDNKAIFVSAYSTEGPIKFKSAEEKEKIHLEIDLKMKELEDSGLSREEILYNKSEGIPLREDKLFQFIKTNKIIREMLIKPTEAFTSDLVIERALKQEIGPDGSLALKNKNFNLESNLHHGYALKQYKSLFSSKKPDRMLRPDDYDYKTNYVDKLKLQVNAEQTRPVSFVNPPMMRSQLRKKFIIRTIRKADVSWKNLPLLTKFLNEGGKLMNKYQTRLPTSVHRRLAKTVKHAREMGLLPFVDFLKPYHKLPLTSLHTNFVEDTAKVVDKKTGMIKLIHMPNNNDTYSYSSYDSVVAASSDDLSK